MSATRALLAHALVALFILFTAASPGPLSPLKADSTRTSAPPPVCPLVSPPVDIQVDHKVNRSPAVTFNPIHGEWLVVWYTKQGPLTWDIWAARLDYEGRVIQTFNVASSAAIQRWEPAVAFSPAQQQYLIVYARQVDPTNPDIYATRVNWNGAWLSKEIPLRIMPDMQYYPSVTYNDHDDEYLVVYTNVWAGTGKDVDALRVRAIDGQIKSWANVQSGADGGERTLADVAYNYDRNQYLIAYDFAGGSALPHSPQIRGKVAAASLAGLSTAPEVELCCDVPSQWGTSVAAGPDEYLVTFANGAFAAPLYYGRRIGHTGQPLGPGTGFPLTQNLPGAGGDVAFAGDRYLATWNATPTNPTIEYNVYACSAMAGHDWAAGDDFIIADETHWQYQSKLACTPHGDCLIVYEDYSPDGKNPRIRGRFVSPCPRVFLPLALRSTHSP